MGPLTQAWLVAALLLAPVVPGLGSPPPATPPSTGTVNLETPAPLPVKQSGAVEPVIHAKSALLIDLPSNTTLFSEKPDTPRPIASLAKLMTALLVVEHTKSDDTVTVPKLSIDPIESQVGFKPGETFTVHDLLSGLLIASGNDAAETLADRVAGSQDNFVAMMNDRARKLGMSDTHFADASGFDKGDTYSTARDLSVLARAVIVNREIRGIVDQKQAAITSVQGNTYQLASTDELLGGYLPIAGLKTGTTDEAGPCLVSLLDSGNRRLLAVVLNSPDRFQENKSMLDWALRAYRW